MSQYAQLTVQVYIWSLETRYSFLEKGQGDLKEGLTEVTLIS